MKTRLTQFEDVFVEILLGLALALLLGIGFAPQLVGAGRQEGAFVAVNAPPAGTATSTQSTPGFHKWLQDGRFGTCLLWICLCMFCLKIVHETSVMQYHLESLRPCQQGRPSRIMSNIGQFLSRVILLGTLYLLIITIYLHGDGEVTQQDVPVVVAFSLLLVFAYFIPNLSLYSFLLHLEIINKSRKEKLLDDNGRREATRRGLRQAVSRWLALDIFNLAGVALIFVVATFWPDKGPLAVAIILVLITGGGMGLWLSRSSSENATAGGWWQQLWLQVRHGCLEWKNDFVKLHRYALVFLYTGIVMSLGSYLYVHRFPLSAQWGIIGILVVNLLDWILNFRFFFGHWPMATQVTENSDALTTA